MLALAAKSTSTPAAVTTIKHSGCWINHDWNHTSPVVTECQCLCVADFNLWPWHLIIVSTKQYNWAQFGMVCIFFGFPLSASSRFVMVTWKRVLDPPQSLPCKGGRLLTAPGLNIGYWLQEEIISTENAGWHVFLLSLLCCLSFLNLLDGCNVSCYYNFTQLTMAVWL